jgi:hypothetical protein
MWTPVKTFTNRTAFLQFTLDLRSTIESAIEKGIPIFPTLTLLREGKQVAVVFARSSEWPALAEVIASVTGFCADEAYFCLDAFVSTDTSVRPKENPEASEALVVTCMDRDKNTEVVIMPYSIGDRGEVTWEATVVQAKSTKEGMEISDALELAFRNQKHNHNDQVTIDFLRDQGHGTLLGEACDAS